MDVFISYAHEDAEFVDRLRRSLIARGREVWVDIEGIEPGDRWKGSAEEAIERADVFVFVLSRAAVASRACLDELDYAVSQNKRVIAICVEQAVVDVEKPEVLSELSWVMMRREDDFGRGLDRLVHALDVDLELVRTHTRILVRARAWELADRRSSPLLRGEELGSAEHWLSRASHASPQPTQLQREFITASRQAAMRRQRTIASVASGVAVMAVVLSIFALIQRSDAIANQRTAQSRLLASEAEANLSSDASLSTLLALRALRIHDTIQAEQALRDALAKLQSLVVLRGHALAVNTAVYSPDGSRVLTGSDDGTARLWDPRSGRQLMVLRVSQYIVSDASYSRDGRRIVTASRDGTGRVWDARTGRVLAVLHSAQHMDTAAFSPDGSRVVTGSEDGAARIWDAGSGRLLYVLTGPRAAFVFATYTPDGSRILTQSSTESFTNYVQVWDPRTARRLAAFFAREKGSAFKGVALSSDGSRIAIMGDPMQIFDTHSGRPLVTLSESFGDVFGAESAAFSPDDTRILGTSVMAEIWSARTGAALEVLGSEGSALVSGSFSPNGSRIVAASSNRTASVWNAQSYTQLLAVPGRVGVSPHAATFSPDGLRIVTGSENGRIAIVDARDGALLGTFGDPSRNVTSAVFSPDGTKILTASPFGPPRLWNARTGHQLIVFGNLPVQKTASFSPDESKVAAGTPVGITLVWNIRGGASLYPMRLHGPPDTPVEDAEFSPDGSRIVTANDDGTARVWNLRTGRQLLILRAPSTADFAAVFSPDGSRIASASADGTVRIWDARTGRQLVLLQGHSDKVNSVAFSPDGSRLATASDDQTSRLWNTHTGAQLLMFTRREAVTSVAFNRNGSEIVTSDGEGVTVFSTKLAGPIAPLERLARTLVTRPFTNQERRTYLAGIE